MNFKEKNKKKKNVPWKWEQTIPLRRGNTSMDEKASISSAQRKHINGQKQKGLRAGGGTSKKEVNQHTLYARKRRGSQHTMYARKEEKGKSAYNVC